MKSLPCDKSAFSLVELLIASVIAAAAGIMLVGGLRAANRSAQIRMAQAITTNVLASQLASLNEQVSAQTPTSGTVPSPLGEFTWTLEWVEAPLAPLVQATLTVTGPQGVTHATTYRHLAQQ